MRDQETRQTASIYDLSADLLDGGTVRLDQFRGRVLLIVNTASRCGFTPQYAELEALYARYHEQGLEVLGFPSNQFGAQEPGTAAQIGAFCEKNYGVTFPLFAKIDVNGANSHPLYRHLKKEKPGTLGKLAGGRIGWNFTKFLVDRQGRVVKRYAPSTKPAGLAAEIERLLAER
jgi:glutathione peroxidase